MHSLPEMERQSAWRLLAQRTAAIEAELLRAYLASAGIEVYLYSKRDCMLHSISATEPVQVWVRAESYDDALRLLIELDAQEPNWEIGN